MCTHPSETVENRNYCMLFVFHFCLLQVFLLVFWSWKLVEPERFYKLQRPLVKRPNECWYSSEVLAFI